MPLEELFDHDDVAKKPTMVPTEADVENINIGTTDNPKMVKLLKSISPKMKGKYVALMAEFSDLFSWDYLDLKVYDKNIIQHTTSVKPDHKPFSQKLRKINPKLLPSIEKEVNRLYKVGIVVPIGFSEWM